MNTLGNVSLLDIFLSKGKYVEPHIHQNASELVYCVSGSAVVSFINPFTNQLINLPIKPGQVANVPQGFWHYEVAVEDNTHLIAIFDAPYPQAIFGSDIMRLTPANVMADTYCLDEGKWKEAIASIKKTVIIGPSNDCNGRQEFEPPVTAYPQQWPAYNPYAAQYYNPQGQTQYSYPAQYNPYY